MSKAVDAHGSALSNATAVAFLVDSSLVLASEWNRVLGEYISPILKRLSESNINRPIRLGLISYGTADTRPSPIITKRFFAPFPVLIKELKEELNKTGIGHTTSSASTGMAVLEGLVATIEMFDILREARAHAPLQPQVLNHSSERDGPPRNLTFHVIHVMAASADGAVNPVCNESSRFDETTWKSLPAEFKKRNIGFSAINLRAASPQSVEFQSALAVGNSQRPWFAVHAPHTVTLTGFPMQAQNKAPKRLAENPTASPEAKRARTVSHPEPPPAPAGIPRAAPPAVPAPQPVPNAGVPRPANIPAALQHVFERMRLTQLAINEIGRRVQSAEAAGNAQHAERLRAEKLEKEATLQNMKTAIQNQLRKPAIPQGPGAMQATRSQAGGSAAVASVPPMPMQSSPTLNSALPTQPQPPAGMNAPFQDPQMMAQMMQSRGIQPQPSQSLPQNGASSSAQGQVPRHGLPPHVAAQMQKLLDQQQQLHRPPTLHNVRPQSQQTPIQPHPNDMSAGAAVSNEPRPGMHWTGTLAWPIGGGRPDMIVEMTAATNVGDMKPEQWSNKVTLAPTRMPIIPMNELQKWCRPYGAVLCIFRPHSRIVNPSANETHVRMLTRNLLERKAYATANWILPSGTREPRMLFWPSPVDDTALHCAVFVNCRMPDVPKSSLGATAMPSMPPNGQPGAPPNANGRPVITQEMLARLNLPPAMLAQLSKVSPEQRQLLLANLMQRRAAIQRQQQQQQQQQQQPQPPQQGIQNNMGFNMPAQPSGGFQDMSNFMNMGAQPGLQQPMGGGVPPPGGMGSVSMEMLQSFMQRNESGAGSGSS